MQMGYQLGATPHSASILA